MLTCIKFYNNSNIFRIHYLIKGVMFNANYVNTNALKNLLHLFASLLNGHDISMYN